jgi:copper(I)-binding protein
MGVLLLSPVALSACSAGQVAQTATQVRDKVGGTAMAEHITVRDARLAYPTSGEYAAGDDAELLVVITNDSEADDTLVGITGEGFDAAEVTGGTEAGRTPSTGGGASGALDVTIPAETNVFIGEDGPTIELTGLADALTVGQGLDVTMSFERAGDVQVRVPVAVPTRELPRGEAFDFHEEEAAGEGEEQLGGSSTE